MIKLYTAADVLAAAEKKIGHLGSVVSVNLLTNKVMLLKHNVLWEGQEYAVLKFNANEKGLDFHTGHYDLSPATAQQLIGAK